MAYANTVLKTIPAVCLAALALVVAQSLHAEGSESLQAEGSESLQAEGSESLQTVVKAASLPESTFEESKSPQSFEETPIPMGTFSVTSFGCGPICEGSSDCVSHCLPCSYTCEMDSCQWEESDGDSRCVCHCY